MRVESNELLSAFLDGEEVDPRELYEAFSAPGARETLRDFVLLRAEIVGDASLPSVEFYRRMDFMDPMMRPETRPEGKRPWWRMTVSVPAPALAALVVVVVGLAIWLGAGRLRLERAAEAPPVPDRIVRLVPGEDWK